MKTGAFFVVFGLCATCAAASRLRAAEASATTWLRGHAAPQEDELAELKTTNPEAYGIVKALLTKRSLGLLDPKHPTPSFNAPAQPAEDAPSGAAAYAAVTTPADEEIEARSEAGASAPPQHKIVDMFNWKPASSAAGDDAADVQNVLGAAAQLTGASSRTGAQEGGAGDADPVAAQPPAPPAAPSMAAQPPAAPVVAAQASAPEENSYLNGLDLTTDAERAKGLSKGADLNADMKMFSSDADVMASEGAPRKAASHQASYQPPAAPAVAAQATAPEDNSYLNSPAPPAAPAVAAPATPEDNSYLKGLDLTTGPSKGADLNADMKMFSSDADVMAVSEVAPRKRAASQKASVVTNYGDMDMLDRAVDASGAPVAAVPQSAPPAPTAKPDALSSWLGVAKVVKKKQQKAVPAQSSNPYLSDLNNN